MQKQHPRDQQQQDHKEIRVICMKSFGLLVIFIDVRSIFKAFGTWRNRSEGYISFCTLKRNNQ
jgi:hypothetical protein